MELIVLEWKPFKSVPLVQILGDLITYRSAMGVEPSRRRVAVTKVFQQSLHNVQHHGKLAKQHHPVTLWIQRAGSGHSTGSITAGGEGEGGVSCHTGSITAGGEVRGKFVTLFISPKTRGTTVLLLQQYYCEYYSGTNSAVWVLQQHRELPCPWEDTSSSASSLNFPESNRRSWSSCWPCNEGVLQAEAMNLKVGHQTPCPPGSGRGWRPGGWAPKEGGQSRKIIFNHKSIGDLSPLRW